MKLSTLTKKQKAFLSIIAACLLVIIIIGYIFFFAPLSKCNEAKYIYITKSDNMESVFSKVDSVSKKSSFFGFCTMMRHSKYADHVRTGRYEIKPGESTFTVFRKIKNGQQTPVMLTIPSVRTADKLAEAISQKLMLDSTEVLNLLNDENVCKEYGYNKETIMCMIIPNTYDIYWDITPRKFLDRMKKESDKFWTDERLEKAKNLKLTPVEVITLASIVEEETANDAEKPMIAGLYYNRLMLRNAEYPEGMPLQADPTIKFALKDFAAKRIYNDMLNVNSPYNTYKNVGLPPGPIRIPSVVGIDAVLDLVHHNYIYMCAKEDFSGTHNFAVTYQEHLANAKKYSEALNKRGIK